VNPPRYPQPSDIGGTLIRCVIASFRAQLARDPRLARRAKLPLEGRIAISVSGGVDSMVLAHLLGRYGRRLIADPRSQLTLLHFDHQWRPESATQERSLVEQLARDLGVEFQSVTLDGPSEILKSDNREEDARLKRYAAYSKLRRGKRGFRFVLTAHHEDDVVETILWRFLRGEFDTHREGILFHYDGCLRPLLQVRKSELQEYARAERVPFLEDPTNRETTQMRAYFRHELFPMLEARYPGFKSSIAQYVKLPTGRRAKMGRKSR
jgi:tRNA(Ile)-lysidine synthase